MLSKVWDDITCTLLNFNGATLCNGCDYLSMLGLKLIHVSKRGHGWNEGSQVFCLNGVSWSTDNVTLFDISQQIEDSVMDSKLWHWYFYFNYQGLNWLYPHHQNTHCFVKGTHTWLMKSLILLFPVHILWLQFMWWKLPPDSWYLLTDNSQSVATDGYWSLMARATVTDLSIVCLLKSHGMDE